jgi:hypothetical protein
MTSSRVVCFIRVCMLCAVHERIRIRHQACTSTSTLARGREPATAVDWNFHAFKFPSERRVPERSDCQSKSHIAARLQVAELMFCDVFFFLLPTAGSIVHFVFSSSLHTTNLACGVCYDDQYRVSDLRPHHWRY